MTEKEFQLIDKRFDTIEKLLAGVNNRLDTINGKVYTHTQQIEEALGERKQNRETQKQVAEKVEEIGKRTELLERAEIQHIINCPISPKLRNIEDKLLSQSSVKKFMGTMFISGVALGGLIVALLKLILG